MKYCILIGFLLYSFLNLAQIKDSTIIESKKNLNEVTVFAIRSSSKMPITQTTLDSKTISQNFYGADIPSLINQHSPSITYFTDNGGPIGISFFRLRGMDNTRVNFSLNGIPMNDTETQGIFFNNWNGLAASAEDIQIQRGVGTSTTGAASIAGSINLLTKTFSQDEKINFSTGFGSFRSNNTHFEYQSGIKNNHSALYLKLGNIYTKGYRENSESHIISAIGSYGFFWKKSQLKFNFLFSDAKDLLANGGLTKTQLEENRRGNSFQHEEGDQFTQGIYQLIFTNKPNANSSLNASLYYVSGKAPYYHYFFESIPYSYINMPNYETEKFTSALGNYQLNQRFWGGFISKNSLIKNWDITYGLHANYFEGDHFLTINWVKNAPNGIFPNHPVYFNTGYKKELTIFSKLTYSIQPNLLAFLDIQLRNVWFSYGEKFRSTYLDQASVEPMSWNFINPKFGLKYFPKPNWNFYIMNGTTFREPTRTDFFGDEFPSKNIHQSQIKPESVNDWELGSELKTPYGKININGFFMPFQNSLINTGQINTSSNSLTTNIDHIIRKGIEYEFQNQSWPWEIYHSFTLMDSRIKNYDQYYSIENTSQQLVKNFKNVQTILSPRYFFNQTVSYHINKQFRLDLYNQVVGKQFIDNTENAYLDPFSLFHLGFSWKTYLLKSKFLPEINLRINNVFGEKYSPYARIGTQKVNPIGQVTTEAYYFPAAKRNFFLTLIWK